MNRNSSRTLLTVAGLVLATVLLTGCPRGGRSQAPAAGAGVGKVATAQPPSTPGTEYVRTAALKNVHSDVDHSTIHPEDDRSSTPTPAERPFCTEPTGGCWARNRRAQFLVKL